MNILITTFNSSEWLRIISCACYRDCAYSILLPTKITGLMFTRVWISIDVMLTCIKLFLIHIYYLLNELKYMIISINTFTSRFYS